MNADEMIQKINTRFAELKKMEQDCVTVIQGKQADLNAILGAQQDCQYWLTQVTSGAAIPEFIPNTEPQPVPSSTSDNPEETKTEESTIQ